MKGECQSKIQRLYRKKIKENKQGEAANSLELLLIIFFVVVFVFLSANVNWF